MIFHVMTFSRLSFYYVTNFRPQKNTLRSANFVRVNIFSNEKKGVAYFDFDSSILNGNFLYVRLDKDNVSLSNPAERGEVHGGKSPSSLNLV